MALKQREKTDWWDHLPLSTHTHVLGVDIVVHQRAIYNEVHGDGHRGGLEPDIEIRTWCGDSLTPWIRRDLAAWARRNLFEGAKPS